MDQMDLGDIRDLLEGVPDYQPGDLVRLNAAFMVLDDLGWIVGRVTQKQSVSLLLEVIGDSVTIMPHSGISSFPVPEERKEMILSHLQGALNDEGKMILQVPVWAVTKEYIQ